MVIEESSLPYNGIFENHDNQIFISKKITIIKDVEFFVNDGIARIVLIEVTVIEDSLYLSWINKRLYYPFLSNLKPYKMDLYIIDIFGLEAFSTILCILYKLLLKQRHFNYPKDQRSCGRKTTNVIHLNEFLCQPTNPTLKNCENKLIIASALLPPKLSEGLKNWSSFGPFTARLVA